MRIQIKVIRFVAIMSVILSAITYLVSLNIEVGFLKLNAPWISNNFALTVFGGAFASMLVVLVCELQKYFQIKRSVQDDLFKHTAYAYIQLILLRNQIQTCLSNPNDLIPKGILDTPTLYLKDEVSKVTELEYCTFSKKSALEKGIADFCNSTAREILALANYISYLTIAINTDKINLLTLRKEDDVTSASPVTNKALKRFEQSVEPLLEKTDVFLHFFDKQCGNRFHWEIRKMAMQVGREQPTHVSFEDFINDNNTTKDS